MCVRYLCTIFSRSPAPPPRSTLFPYTTLFRSGPALRDRRVVGRATAEGARPGEERSPGRDGALGASLRSEEHTSELQSLTNLVCRLLLEKKKRKTAATIADDKATPTQADTPIP